MSCLYGKNCQNFNERKQKIWLLEEEILENFKTHIATENELQRHSAKLTETLSTSHKSTSLSISRSSSISLSINDGLSNVAKQICYKGPSPPLSEVSGSNLISSSKCSHSSSNMLSTSAKDHITNLVINTKEWELFCKAVNWDTHKHYSTEKKIIFIEKTDAALGIEGLKLEKRNIFNEILLMLDKVKITRNFEEINQNLEMHIDIYGLYLDHIKNIFLEN